VPPNDEVKSLQLEEVVVDSAIRIFLALIPEG
jgi:hypothetical protein